MPELLPPEPLELLMPPELLPPEPLELLVAPPELLLELVAPPELPELPPLPSGVPPPWSGLESPEPHAAPASASATPNAITAVRYVVILLLLKGLTGRLQVIALTMRPVYPRKGRLRTKPCDERDKERADRMGLQHCS